MTTLYLVRHGQTDWNIEGRWQGHADIPLNSIGHTQADQIAKSLANAGLQAIYSSDLKRAAETARALSAITRLAVRYDPRLREINQGEWQGLLASDVEMRYAELLEHSRRDPLNVAPPGGETVLEVRSRLMNAIDDICREHPHDRVAVVSHGFALAVVWVHYQGLPIQTVWDYIPPNDEWRVLEINNP